jgi:chemotaxis protein CheD
VTVASGLVRAPARRNVIHVIQGEFAISDEPDAVISTLLGSCVSACIRDPRMGIGGLNHFLLPDGGPGSSSLSYGVNAMELLINALLRRGADRTNLEAKLFGGARLFKGLTDVGTQNAKFAMQFLRDEGIAYAGGSLGGTSARKIEFSPATGRARQQILERDQEVFVVEARSAKPAVAEPDDGLELW